MLMIRLLRVGKRNQPIFKIVVTEKRNSPKRGRFVEELGFINPLTKEKSVNKDRASYWLSVGAQPSDTVHNLFIDEKVITGEKRRKHAKSKKKTDAETAEAKEGQPATGENQPSGEQPATEEKKPEIPAKEAKEEAKEPAPAKATASSLGQSPTGEALEADEGQRSGEGEGGEEKPRQEKTDDEAKEESQAERKETAPEKKPEKEPKSEEPKEETEKPKEEAKEEVKKEKPASPSTPLRTGDKDSAGEGGEEKPVTAEAKKK